MNNNRISDKLYKEILMNVPISTVDFIVTRKINGTKEFLLAKRNNNPYKGQWFVPGGRIILGETLEKAVKRILKDELGILKYESKFVGCYTLINPPGPLGVKWHSIWHIHEIIIDSNVKIKLSKEDSDVSWFSKINKNWAKPVKDTLEITGF